MTILESKGQPPMTIDPDGPMVREFSLERVQSPSWRAHIVWSSGNLKPRKLQPKSFRMFGLDSTRAASPVESLDTLVPKAPDHEFQCIA